VKLVVVDRNNYHLFQVREAGFQYKDLGSMATIGKSRAVVEIGPLRFSGFLAWLAWLVLHITVLIGFRNRISVLVSWIYAYAFSRRGSRLITRSSESAPSTVKSGKSRSATQSPVSLRYVSSGGGLQEVPIGKGSGPCGESEPATKSAYHQNRS